MKLGIIFAGMVCSLGSASAVLLEEWTYSGVSDGALLNAGSGTESLPTGNNWANKSPFGVVSNQMQRWAATGADNESGFNDVGHASYANATNGTFELIYDVVSADFSNTEAFGGKAQFGYGIRDSSLTGGDRNGVLLVRYDDTSGQNMFRLSVSAGSTVQEDIANGPVISNLHVRAVYDLGNVGSFGSFIGYFSVDGGPETAVTNSLATGFTFETVRMHIQALNGGNSWQVGDVVTIDNIRLSSVGESASPPNFDSNPVIVPGAVTNQSYTGITLADYASDPNDDPMTFWKAADGSWLSVGSDGGLSGTPLAGDLGTNTWTVWVTDGNSGTNSATLQINVIASAPPVASPDRTRLHPTNTYNVLFIPIDDMRPLINAYGEDEPLQPSTPNMDRLADSGVWFANAHCQQAVCNASRASLMTGLRPDTTMCWKLDTHFRTPLPDIITLPQHFGNQGYTVHGIGKIYHGISSHNQDEALSWKDGWTSPQTPYKWYETDKAIAEDGGNNKVSATDAGEVDRGGNPIEDADYNDGNAAALGVVKIAEYAEDFHTNGIPFFLAVGLQKPHLPFNCPKAYWDLYDPAQINLTNYTGIRNMPVGSNKFTAPYGGEPKAFDDVTGTSDNGMPTATEARHLIHGYLACVSFIDAQIGKLLDALEDPDGNPLTDDSIADNTIIVLWGDHGFHLGDHNGFWAKHSNYEISTRVPLIVSTPALADLGAAGRRSTALVELVDLYPTLVDLCSLPSPEQPIGQRLQGTTFLPLLEDPVQPWKHAVFSQYQRTIKDSDPGDTPVTSSGSGMGYSIRTERYRYTEWWVTDSTDETDRHIIKAGITEPGLIELYDYVNDPDETTNLASNAAYTNLTAELSALLNDADMTSAGDGWSLPETDAPGAYPVDPDVWRTNYLAPGRLMAELEDGADPDGDFMINRFEYKFGTHPFEAEPSPVSSGLTNGRIFLTYPDVESRTNILLSATSCTNLLTGPWTSAGVVQTNIGQQGNATIKSSSIGSDASARFLLLEASEL